MQKFESLIELPLSDAAWERVKHLFAAPGPTRGRPRRDVRLILNAILWITQNDERWHRLPLTFPSPQTCYAKFLAWRRTGLLQQVSELLCATTLEGGSPEN